MLWNPSRTEKLCLAEAVLEVRAGFGACEIKLKPHSNTTDSNSYSYVCSKAVNLLQVRFICSIRFQWSTDFNVIQLLSGDFRGDCGI